MEMVQAVSFNILVKNSDRQLCGKTWINFAMKKKTWLRVSEQATAFQYQQLKRMGEFNQAAAGKKKKNPRRVIDFYELGVKRSINYSQGNRDGRFLGRFSASPHRIMSLDHLARLSHS